jgi:hydrogenase maturation protease
MKASRSILVAGIGNIFMGDDAFGVETLRSLQREGDLPESVRAVDFGIRSYDLAYAIAGKEDHIILVDAAPKGEAPGTLYLIQPDTAELRKADTEVINGHTLNPVSVLKMALSLNADALRSGRIYLVGCEPEVLEVEDGRMELSPAVEAAVPEAVKMIRTLVRQLS